MGESNQRRDRGEAVHKNEKERDDKMNIIMEERGCTRREREMMMKMKGTPCFQRGVYRKGEEFTVEAGPLDRGDSCDMDTAVGSCHDDLYTTIIDIIATMNFRSYDRLTST